MSSKRNYIGIMLPPSLTESFEIVLARAVDLHRSGERVRILYCSGAVRGCVANPLRILGSQTCRHCNWVTRRALSTLLPQVEQTPIDSAFAAPAFHYSLSDDEMLRLKASAESTVLTFYRAEPSRSIRRGLRHVALKRSYQNMFQYSLATYGHVAKALPSLQLERLEYFNGRIVPTLAIGLAAAKGGIPHYAVEVAGSKRNLVISKGGLVHDLQRRKTSLLTYTKSDDVDYQLGRTFFLQRRSGGETDTQSYVTNQRSGLLDFDSNLPIIAIFTSSPDEFRFLGPQWFNPCSQDPTRFIERLYVSVVNKYQLVVRMHPNQAGDRTGESVMMERRLSKLPGLILIGPSDPHSTYELLEKSDHVLTFGSTVGLEATFWGKPSILAGRAIWEDLDIARQTHSLEETLEALHERHVGSKEHAVAAAAYFMAGEPYSGSLTWINEGSAKRFYVDGLNFLKLKRQALSYWIVRLVEKWQRL